MIGPFKGEYAFLSNFYAIPIQYEGERYPSVEHAYQAAKTADPTQRERIRLAATSGEAKRLDRRVKLVPGWDDMKLDVMRSLLRQKFSHPLLGQSLRQTLGHELIEINWWGDTFWGVCNGQGDNWLGRLLMDIRIEIIEGHPVDTFTRRSDA